MPQGNGQVFSPEAQLQFTFTFTRSTIISSKRSELQTWPSKLALDRDLTDFCLSFRMYGLFQTTFYFGYMALMSGALGILCGKCRATLTSVRHEECEAPDSSCFNRHFRLYRIKLFRSNHLLDRQNRLEKSFFRKTKRNDDKMIYSSLSA